MEPLPGTTFRYTSTPISIVNGVIRSMTISRPVAPIANRQAPRIMLNFASAWSNDTRVNKYASPPWGTERNISPPTASHRSATPCARRTASAPATISGTSYRIPLLPGCRARMLPRSCPCPPPTSTMHRKREKSKASTMASQKPRDTSDRAAPARSPMALLARLSRYRFLFPSWAHRASPMCFVPEDWRYGARLWQAVSLLKGPARPPRVWRRGAREVPEDPPGRASRRIAHGAASERPRVSAPTALRQGLLPRKPAIATRALNSALCCFLFTPTSHAPLDRSAFSLSRCPKIRRRRTPSWVDGTPQVHPLAGDPYHHLVEVQRLLGCGRRRRSRRAITGPNFSSQHRTVSSEMSSPRSASSSSTSR